MINWGILGLGRMGVTFADSILELSNSKLIAVGSNSNKKYRDYKIFSYDEVLKNENADGAEIKAKLDALNTAAMKLGEIMYKQNPQANQSASPDQENTKNEDAGKKDAKDDNVVDADFEEVNEESEKKSN